MKEISINELVHILANLEFESESLSLIKRFPKYSKEVESNKLTSKHFWEYLFFELFTDQACFALVFEMELSSKLLNHYSIEIINRLISMGYNPENDIEDLFKKRCVEYHPYLQEYDLEFIKKINPNTYLSGLGKAFSMNFVGYYDPLIIDHAHLEFLVKLKHIPPFLRQINHKYKIVVK